jgi:hypothetical protein
MYDLSRMLLALGKCNSDPNESKYGQRRYSDEFDSAFDSQQSLFSDSNVVARFAVIRVALDSRFAAALRLIIAHQEVRFDRIGSRVDLEYQR